MFAASGEELKVYYAESTEKVMLSIAGHKIGLTHSQAFNLIRMLEDAIPEWNI